MIGLRNVLLGSKKDYKYESTIFFIRKNEKKQGRGKRQRSGSALSKLLKESSPAANFTNDVRLD
jgi:hypothetical protein